MVDVTITIEELPTLSKKQSKFKNAFQSAKSADQSLKAFNKMAPSFHESDLALPCWNLAELLLNQARPEEALVFGKRALKILLSNMNSYTPCFGKYSPGILTTDDAKGVSRTCSVIHNSSLFIASVCNVLGTACVGLKRYDEGLSYLNWANRNLSKLEKDDEEMSCVGDCVLQDIVTNQFQLFRAKFCANRYEELPLHMIKSLEVKRKMLDEGCVELGDANMEVSMAYTAASLNFKDALPFGLEALEIRMKHFSSDSVEVMETRQHLGWIYHELGEYEKELEQKELSKEFVDEEEDDPDSMIESGRYEEAIAVLKDEVLRDDMEGYERAKAFISMARAFYKLGKFPDAKKRLRTAQRILEKIGLNQVYVGILFEDMSRLYEKMNDFETALSLIRKVLAYPNLPQALLSQCASRIFSLLPKSGKEKKRIPYMLDLVSKLKESFGSEHREVGCGYAHLGVAYWNLGQRELAVKYLADAKGIMDATIGPYHVNSLKTSQILATSYAKMGSYDLAIGIQENVVQGFKASKPSEQGFLEKAVVWLEKMKEVAAESPTSPSPQFEDDGEDLSEMMSKCGISDDETEK